MEKKELNREVELKALGDDKVQKLNAVNNQLIQQLEMFKKEYEKLLHKYQKVNNEAFYKRLDYLFKVIDGEARNTFPHDFTEACRSEIIELLTIPEKEEDKKGE